MVWAGQIIENRRGEFCLAKTLGLLTGTVSAHIDAFGFVRRDDSDEVVYLSAREMHSLIDGDRVVIKIVDTDRQGVAKSGQALPDAKAFVCLELFKKTSSRFSIRSQAGPAMPNRAR